MTSLISTGVLTTEARVYCGMWIADCQFCQNAVPPTIGTPSFRCGYCGTVSEIVWPSLEMIYGVERLLAMRPLPYNRNWFPHETLNDLIMENGQHGVLDRLVRPELGFAEGTSVLAVDDTSIRRDELPLEGFEPPREIGA